MAVIPELVAVELREAVDRARPHPVLEGVPAGAEFYFVHSYACAPDDPALVVGEADYGQSVWAAVARDNVFACQFHPEKSQHAGARLLQRFLEDAWS